MKKTIKNFDLVNIQNILEKNADKRLPQKISFAITKTIMNLAGDVECYQKSLQKIFEVYKDYYVMNEDGSDVVKNNIGLPVLSDEAKTKEMVEEINELLSVEIEVELYAINEDVFNYDDPTNRYDAISAKDILALQSVLCIKESNDETTDND